MNGKQEKKRDQKGKSGCERGEREAEMKRRGM